VAPHLTLTGGDRPRAVPARKALPTGDLGFPSKDSDDVHRM